jgi:hypothetical protein
MFSKKNIFVLALLIINIIPTFAVEIELFNTSADTHWDWELYADAPETYPPSYFWDSSPKHFFFKGNSIDMHVIKHEDAAWGYTYALRVFNSTLNRVIINYDLLAGGDPFTVSTKRANFTITTDGIISQKINAQGYYYYCHSQCKICEEPSDYSCRYFHYDPCDCGWGESAGGITLDLIPDNVKPIYTRPTTTDPYITVYYDSSYTDTPFIPEPSGTIYSKLPIRLQATASDGTGSGIFKNQYYIIPPKGNPPAENSWKDTFINFLNANYTAAVGDSNDISTEGINQVEFRAIDKVGNISDTISRFVVYDKRGPANVTNIQCSFKQSVNTDIEAFGLAANKIDGIDVAWDKVTVDNPVGGCGVKGYNISWKPAGSTGSFASENKETITSLSYSIDDFEHNFARGKTYTIAVQSVDNLGNTGNWVEKEIAIPSYPAEIKNVR